VRIEQRPQDRRKSGFRRALLARQHDPSIGPRGAARAARRLPRRLPTRNLHRNGH
jgi:hypothetical protein